MAPARVTTAVVIASSARLRVSARMSDHMKNVPIARTTVAIITGTNSRRSSPRDIFPTLDRSSHLFAGINFEIVNEGREFELPIGRGRFIRGSISKRESEAGLVKPTPRHDGNTSRRHLKANGAAKFQN